MVIWGGAFRYVLVTQMRVKGGNKAGLTTPPTNEGEVSPKPDEGKLVLTRVLCGYPHIYSAPA